VNYSFVSRLQRNFHGLRQDTCNIFQGTDISGRGCPRLITAMEVTMRRTICVAATALLLLSGAAFAQSNTPGHEMQNKGSKAGSPGASGYSPGHEMQNKGSKSGSPGASGYAPGHSGTTGSAGSTGTGSTSSGSSGSTSSGSGSAGGSR
jgi:hypothetical protein